MNHQNRAQGRDHGGDLDRARAAFGGDDWIDLSTGINRDPYPLPDLPARVWRDLPDRNAQAALVAAAAGCFGCAPGQVLALAGASAAIQLVPGLRPAGRAAVLWPSYNEHGAALAAAGWQVGHVQDIRQMAGAGLAVVVNPNNPDGRCFAPETLRDLARQVGLLVVDESFADPRPDLTIAADIPDNTLVLRSFGKFWGLAGLRLGFALGAPGLLAQLAERAGPWAVSGPALAIGAQALADRGWHGDTVTQLSESALRMDQLALRAGWQLVGGAHLFRLYRTADAAQAQTALARHRIWSRIFPYSPHWLRLGLPGNRDEWDRVRAAFEAL